MATTIIQEARAEIDGIMIVAGAVCNAVRGESKARDDRDEFLSASVNSLIGQPNPLTSKDHSATSAEKAAKDTDDYKAKDEAVLSAECARILAWADYERCKLSARLSVVAAEAN